MPSEILNDDVVLDVDSGTGYDNALGGAPYDMSSTALAVFGAEQVIFYLHCDAGSEFTGCKMFYSYDNTTFAELVSGEQNCTIGLSAAYATMVDGKMTAILLPKVGRYIPVASVKFVFTIADTKAVAGLDVTAVRFPLDRPALAAS